MHARGLTFVRIVSDKMRFNSKCQKCYNYRAIHHSSVYVALLSHNWHIRCYNLAKDIKCVFLLGVVRNMS